MTDVMELLKGWPTWAHAGAETILASPAWRLPVRYGEASGVMTVGGACDDVLVLDITLDGEPYVLALADSSLYPDLHLLWTQRANLPQEVLLALVEKECGGVLAMVENLVRRQLGVKGIAEAATCPTRAYTVALPDGAFAFAIDFPTATIQAMARLENLDVTHESIRTLTRSAYVSYAVLMLTEEERTALKPGDFILLPENFPATQAWTTEPPEEGTVRVISRENGELTFAALADEALPPIPQPESLALALGATRLPCELVKVGTAPAIKIN